VRILSALAAALEWINEMIGRAASWLTVLVVVNVFVVALLRYLFGFGQVWMQELYVWLNAAMFMLAAGYTLLHDGHVRIDVFYREASQRYKTVVDLLGSLFLGLPLMWLMFDRSLPLVMRSWLRGEQSSEAGGLPGLYLLKSVLVGFAVVMALQLVAVILRSLVTLAGGSADGGEGGR
jgi:TRAP-type mannitol/chloroaromatic compound transport system permease small subunit